MPTPEFLLDKRVVERNISKGLVTRDDLAKHVQNLPDVEANAEPCVPAADASEAASADETEEEG